MRNSDDWNICVVLENDLQRMKERLIRWGAQVLWFREERTKRVQVAKNKWKDQPYFESMFKGYLFFRGVEPSDLRARPGCPHLMRSNGDYAFVRATRMARLQLLIGGEILREEKLYYLRGDKVLFQHFCATVDFVRNTSKGQILTVSTKILGKTIVKDVSSQGVELVSLTA